MDCSLSESSVPGIFQARILEWVAISFPRDLADPGIEPMSLRYPALASGFFSAIFTCWNVAKREIEWQEKLMGDQLDSQRWWHALI